jgi:dienelactone hydrolase
MAPTTSTRTGRPPKDEPPKVGVVMIPDVFGPGHTFEARVWELRKLGFPTRVSRLGLWLPLLYVPYLTGRRATNRYREDLIRQVSWNDVQRRVTDAVVRLRQAGCVQVMVMGFGYGAEMAIAAAGRRLADPQARIDGVIGWYPRLTGSFVDPAPELAAFSCPALLFYGDADRFTRDARPYAEIACRGRPTLRVETLSDLGHDFAEATLHGWCPNPHYHKNSAHYTWSLALAWLGEAQAQVERTATNRPPAPTRS